jgi:transposase InsO family protein
VPANVGVRHRFTRPYRSQPNGKVERQPHATGGVRLVRVYRLVPVRAQALVHWLHRWSWRGDGGATDRQKR